MAMTTAFQLSPTVSTHPAQVNRFSDLDEVYKTYLQGTEGRSHRLVIPSDGKNVIRNEVKVALEYQRVINPLLRQLIDGRGYKPGEQHRNFIQLIKANPQDPQIEQLRSLADKVVAWKGFELAAEDRQMGLEFLTEWTHTGARMIDNVHAFGYADYVVKNQVEDLPGSWKAYLTQDERAKKMHAFRQAIQDITDPQDCLVSDQDTEGMSISTALQDFRRKAPWNGKLPEKGNAELEQDLLGELKELQEKIVTIREGLHHYPSMEQVYQTLKEGGKSAPPELTKAHNLRRECGGTGFLVALQQAIKGEGVSQAFYLTHQKLINDTCELCNEMDKNNFEILLGYGKYEGDAIPSPYAFFEQLSARV